MNRRYHRLLIQGGELSQDKIKNIRSAGYLLSVQDIFAYVLQSNYGLDFKNTFDDIMKAHFINIISNVMCNMNDIEIKEAYKITNSIREEFQSSLEKKEAISLYHYYDLNGVASLFYNEFIVPFMDNHNFLDAAKLIVHMLDGNDSVVTGTEKCKYISNLISQLKKINDTIIVGGNSEGEGNTSDPNNSNKSSSSAPQPPPAIAKEEGEGKEGEEEEEEQGEEEEEEEQEKGEEEEQEEQGEEEEEEQGEEEEEEDDEGEPEGEGEEDDEDEVLDTSGLNNNNNPSSSAPQPPPAIAKEEGKKDEVRNASGLNTKKSTPPVSVSNEALLNGIRKYMYRDEKEEQGEEEEEEEQGEEEEEGEEQGEEEEEEQGEEEQGEEEEEEEEEEEGNAFDPNNTNNLATDNYEPSSQTLFNAMKNISSAPPSVPPSSNPPPSVPPPSNTPPSAPPSSNPSSSNQGSGFISKSSNKLLDILNDNNKPSPPSLNLGFLHNPESSSSSSHIADPHLEPLKELTTSINSSSKPYTPALQKMFGTIHRRDESINKYDLM